MQFSTRRFLLGFENANSMLRTVDKRAVIGILGRNGAKIGDDCDIESPLIIHNCRDYENLTVGSNCHIGKDVFFDLKFPIKIEDRAIISMRVTVITHLDVGGSPLKNMGFPVREEAIIFGKGCYVGAGALILPGVRIGECAVVAAGSVVTHNVASYTVVGGVPARLIRRIPRTKHTD
ncbi:MAG: acyltransferase [candidate division WOR-3 bacterium]|nr:MAG: acyltransferase [candidate division WOR-3 bacterium]